MTSLPQLLEHIDVERWERPAQLLRLIDVLREGPNPVPLSRQILRAAGRTDRQAKYDHQVLVRLAERDRVLMRWRGSGRRPDSWQIADPTRWRNVPWISRRRDVISAFCGLGPDEAVVLWTKRAARAVGLGTNTPLLEALCEAGLSVNLRSTTPRHMSTTPQVEGGFDPLYVHNATALSGPIPITSSSEIHSLPNPPTAEGGSEGFETKPDPGNMLLSVVQETVESAVFGPPAERIRGVGRRHPDRMEELYDFARSLKWVRTGTGAAKAIVEYESLMGCAPSPFSGHRAQRIQGLRNQLRILNQLDPGGSRAAEIEAELAALEEQTSTAAEG